MANQKHAHRPLATKSEQPFASPEEAWLWYAVSQLARNEGARPVADAGSHSPPCTPDDIYRVVKALYASGRLSVRHVKVLFGYGLKLMIPNAKVRGEERAAGLWDEALDLMSTPFRAKGIVA